MSNEVYLGDGLYASSDGYYIVLSADKGSPSGRTVYLEPGGWERLVRFAEKVWEIKGEGSDLTPTEHLVMEVLASRFRSGEAFWTFERRIAPTIRSLAEKGLVFEMSGIVEKTIRAGLTERGQSEWLKSDFQTPDQREIARLRVELREVRELNASLYQRQSAPCSCQTQP